MKNPKTNPKIEAIKQRLKSEYLPEGNIPNSRVARQIDLLDATATLEYAKMQNRPVRKAEPRECHASIELDYKRKTENFGFLDTKSAAKYLGVSESKINQMKRDNLITCTIRQGKAHFLRSELDHVSNTNPFFVPGP